MLDKKDIFFVFQSYILECLPQLLPRDILSSMSFEDIGANIKGKQQIIEGILEIFSLGLLIKDIEKTSSLQEVIDFLYSNKVQ